MKYLTVVMIFSVTPYLQADPSPDVHIQNYDGPIFVQSSSPNCCPLCNSILRSQPNNGLENLPPTPGIYPKKAIYGTEVPIITQNPETCTTIPVERGIVPVGNTLNPIGAGIGLTENPLVGKDIPVANAIGPLGKGTAPLQKDVLPAENGLEKILHNKDTTPGVTYSVPVSSVNTVPPSGSSYNPLNTHAIPSPLESIFPVSSNFGGPGLSTFSNHGNTFPGTTTPISTCTIPAYGQTRLESNNFCGTNHYTPTFGGTEYKDLAKPVTNYLSSGVGSQNSCYNVPIAVCNKGSRPNDEPVLVPQKFSYSLILDGEVAKNFGQNSPPYYYC